MSMHPDPLPLVRTHRVRPLKDPDKHPVAMLLGMNVVDDLALLYQIAATEKALMHAISNVRINIPTFLDVL